MNYLRGCLVALLCLFCVFVTTTTAHASEPLAPEFFAQYAQEMSEFATEIEAGQSFVYAPGVTDFTLAARAGTQSPAELEEMQMSSRPAVFLTMEDGTLVAGAYTDIGTDSRIAVDWLYGCNRATNACLYTGNGNRMGYKDRGYLSVNVADTRIVAAGSNTTLFTRNTGSQYLVLPGKQMRMNFPATIVSLQR